MKATSRPQFSARISKDLRNRLRREKPTAGTNDILCEVAMEFWLTKYTHEQRAQFYRAHWANSRKPYVRA
jgi:hypothetical protein